LNRVFVERGHIGPPANIDLQFKVIPVLEIALQNLG